MIIHPATSNILLLMRLTKDTNYILLYVPQKTSQSALYSLEHWKISNGEIMQCLEGWCIWNGPWRNQSKDGVESSLICVNFKCSISRQIIHSVEGQNCFVRSAKSAVWLTPKLSRIIHDFIVISNIKSQILWRKMISRKNFIFWNI